MGKQTLQQKLLAGVAALSLLAGMVPASALAAGGGGKTESGAVTETAAISTSETAQTATPETARYAARFALRTASLTPDNQQANEAYFIKEVKLVPKDITLEAPTDTSTSWEPDVKWDVAGAAHRSGEVQLWFKYLMPDENTPQRGVDYVSYIEAPLTLEGEEPRTTEVMCGNDRVASVKIEKSGTPGRLKMTISFLEEAKDIYFKPGVPGYFWTTVKFDEERIPNDGKQKIAVRVDKKASYETDIDFDVDTPEIEAKVDKDAAIDQAKKTITWTAEATVTAKKLPSGQHTATVTLTDTMKNQTYVQDSAKIDGTSGTLAATPGEDNASVTFTLDHFPLENGENKVQFTYQTSYADADLSQIMGTDGKAKFPNTIGGGENDGAVVPNYDGGKDENGQPIPNGTTTVKIAAVKKEPTIQVASLEKTVTTTDLNDLNVTLRDGMLFWKILVDSELSGQKLFDTVGAGQALVVDENHPLTIGAYETKNGANTSYADTYIKYNTFNNNTTDAGIYQDTASGSYIITLGQTGKTMVCYYTKINGTDQSLTNTVRFAADGIGNGPSSTKTYNLKDSFVSKKGNGYDASTQTIHWQATVTNGGFLYGDHTLVDTFDKDYDQKLLMDSVKLTLKKDGSEKVYKLDENGKFGNIGTLTVKKSEDGSRDTGFTVNLPGLDNQYETLVLDYDTRLLNTETSGKDLAAWVNQTKTVNNSLTLKTSVAGQPDITADGSQKCATPVLKKEAALLDENGYPQNGTVKNHENYDYASGTAAWKITVDEAKMALGTVTLTDTLTYDATHAPWDYVQDSVKVWLDGSTVEPTAKTFGTDADGNPTMTLTLPGLTVGQGPYIVTYRTWVNRAHLGTNVTQQLKNSVRLTGGPIQNTEVKANAEVSVKAGKIAKTAAMDSDYFKTHLITWTITVNNNLADISDAETVYDQLESGLLYLPDTVTIQKFTRTTQDGKPTDLTAVTVDGPTPAYDEKTGMLTFDFVEEMLDTTGYVITYQTRVMDGKDHVNHASFNKDDLQDADHASGAAASSHYTSGFTVILGTGTVRIRKVDADGNLLANAKFTLYRKLADGSWDNGTELTTTDSGITVEGLPADDAANAVIVGLPYGSYKLVETAAPSADYALSTVEDEFTLDAVHQVKTIERVNYLIAQSGRITLQKTITGLGTDAKPDGKLKFEVRDADGALKATYPLEAFTLENGVYTLTSDVLPVGAYTVAEVAEDIDGYKLAETTPASKTVEVTVTADETPTAAFTNRYEKIVVATATPTPTPEPTEPPKTTAAPSATPQPTVTPTAAPTPTPAPTATPAPADTAQPAATAAPKASEAPAPTPQPTIPRTADAFPLTAAGLALLAGGLGVMGLGLAKRRRKM